VVLVTGGTGFIGQAVVRRLSEAGREIRILLRPSHRSPNLPQGIAVEVAIANLLDKRGVRAALVGVDSVIHLASAEAHGREAGLQGVDIQGTALLAAAASQAKVKRLIFVSHLGAELSSAFPVLRAKAMAEQSIQRSSVPATVLRSSLAYGPGDRFTSAIAMLLSISPLVFPLPGNGTTALQPIWVEDLATCILWALEEPRMVGQTYEIGGPEFLTVEQLTRLIKRVAGSRRWSYTPRRPRCGPWPGCCSGCCHARRSPLLRSITWRPAGWRAWTRCRVSSASSPHCWNTNLGT